MGYRTATRYYWKYAGKLHWRKLTEEELAAVPIPSFFRYSKLHVYSSKSDSGSPYPYVEIKAVAYRKTRNTRTETTLNAQVTFMKKKYQRLMQHFKNKPEKTRRRIALEIEAISKGEWGRDMAILTVYNDDGAIERQYKEMF